MKTAIKISAMLAVMLSFAAVASAQYAPPPPPPPPPPAGPEAAPPPAAPPAASPPVVTPAPSPYRCGVPNVSPCARRPPVYYRPRRHRWRQRFYLGAGAGAFGIIGAKGPYDYISAGGTGTAWIGVYLSRLLALELGFMGSAHREQFSEFDSYYWGSNELLMWGVTLDAKLNLTRPGWRRRLVPYLQGGIGAYGLVGDYYDDLGYVGSKALATGVGVQLGGGLDLYLTRWLVLGVRVLYRGIAMGKVKCGNSGDRCVSRDEADRTMIHGLTGELNMSIVF